MNLRLPPERDLPARALREMEARIVTAMDHRRRRPWIAPVAAAVAVLVTLGVVVGVLRGGDEDRARPAASAVPSTSAPAPSWSEPPPTGKRESILPGCVETYGLGGTAEEKARAEGAELYNLLGTPSKGLALIYAEHLVIYCIVGGPVTAYNAGGGPVGSLHWIQAPYRTDFQSSSQKTVDGKLVATHTLGGRISKDVAVLTVQSGGDVVEAHLENRTFVVELSSESAAPPVLRAYDANGTEIPKPPAAKCLRTPGGELIDNDDSTGDLNDCAPAVAWP